MTKKWYQQTWGIVLLLILFFPVGIYLMWRYADWSQKAKIIVSVIFAIITVSIAMNPAEPKTQQAKQEEKSQATVQQKPTPTFDVPALIVLNIDDIRKQLGSPTDKDVDPTAKQMELGTTEWYNSFDKNGKTLLVTYDPTTRTVIDLFCESTSEQEAKDYCNLNSGGNFTTETVKSLKNSSEITGVKVIPKNN